MYYILILECKLFEDDVFLFTAVPPAPGSVPGIQLGFTELINIFWTKTLMYFYLNCSLTRFISTVFVQLLVFNFKNVAFYLLGFCPFFQSFKFSKSWFQHNGGSPQPHFNASKTWAACHCPSIQVDMPVDTSPQPGLIILNHLSQGSLQ